MTPKRIELAWVTAIAAMFGCEPRSVGETYDNSCDERSECRVVHHASCSCSCNVEAINVEESDRFVADNEAFCILPQPPCEACLPFATDCVDDVCVVFDCTDDTNSAERVEICRDTTSFVAR